MSLGERGFLRRGWYDRKLPQESMTVSSIRVDCGRNVLEPPILVLTCKGDSDVTDGVTKERHLRQSFPSFVITSR